MVVSSISSRWFRIVGAISATACIVIVSASSSIINKPKPAAVIQHYIIVLGLKPNSDGSLKAPLLARIDAAQQVYADLHPKQGRSAKDAAAANAAAAVKIIVTGADVAKLGFTEAHAMAQAMIQMNGNSNRTIPVDDIWLEEKAVDTIENAIYTLDMILARSKTMSYSASRLILITSQFHMPRSWFIFDCVLRHYRATKGLDMTWETTVASPNLWSAAVDENRTLYDRLVFERYLLPKMIPMLEQNHSIPAQNNDATYQKAWQDLQVMISQQHENEKSDR
jgi:uncharacterized SAM-binding protein YcdF (DUF218 family)